MSAKEVSPQNSDREALVKTTEPKYHSQWCIFASIFFGVALLSLIIYGFMSVLRFKRSHENYDEFERLNDTRVAFGGEKPDRDDQCKPVDFAYLILAIRWSIGACENLHCIPQLQKEWLIHGLWPNYNNNSWPEFCCDKDGFNISEVQSLVPKLEKSWKNLLLNQQSESLWRHEWNKHGTCSYKNKKIRGEFNYFSKSLTLFEAVNVGRLLEDVGVKPGDTTTKDVVKKALAKAFGTQVSLHCVSEGSYLAVTPESNDESDLKRQVLESVHYCYTPDNFEPIDCADHDQCPSSFLYPSQVSK